VYAHVIQDVAPAVADTFARAIAEASEPEIRGAVSTGVSKQSPADDQVSGETAGD
jgi:hypothetical protein